MLHWIVLFSVHLLAQDVSMLRMVGVSIPQYPEAGQTVDLICNFQLQGDKLYSVSWYKDFNEFYRFVPRGTPMQHVYWIDAIRVDLNRSDAQRAVVQSVTLKASGLYMCEVSAEAPSFASVHGQAWMTVIVLPRDGPSISGGRSQYRIGDELNLTCTAGPSHPATTLQWFINNQLVTSQSQMTQKHNNQLFLSSARLQLTLRADHFLQGQVNVRCLASLPTLNFEPVQSVEFQKETYLQVRGGKSRNSSFLYQFLILLVLLPT